ncbi:MAG: hypothetical protein JWO67_4894 [Streptosporangiaceae bacterium]|nr:hypothetical protein [Streptosporangiaceae bacterium]
MSVWTYPVLAGLDGKPIVVAGCDLADDFIAAGHGVRYPA